MAEPAGARQLNLNLTPEEKRVFYQFFQAADTTNLGVITGEVAVPFFEKTKLSPEILGLIWQIADRENRGLLTPSGFGIVLRLIGHAQAGRAPSEELALQPGPLPHFDGIVVDAALPTSPRPRTSEPAAVGSPSQTAGPIRVPPLNPEDVNKFTSLFEKSDVQNGLLSGETAKQIFERARLPNEILGRIWSLADTKQRGALDVTEFIIAMHLLTSFKSGAMRSVPHTLPPGLYDAASRKAPSRSSISSRSGSDIPPVPAIPKQFTGSTPQRIQSPLGRQPLASPMSTQLTGGDWLVSPQEKAHFDNIFASMDTARTGVISGEQAVNLFMNAKLPEETLATIWDLADIDADGQLTRDEFAVAMYLILQQRTSKEPLPRTLPPALVPPSVRRHQMALRPGTAGQASASSAPPPVAAAGVPSAARSAAEDLFGLDSFPSVPAPAQAPQLTGGSNAQFQFQTPASPKSAASPPRGQTSFKPFVPSSSFGQSLQPQYTGASSAGTSSTVRSPPSPLPPLASSDDLLGDNDPEESKKLTQETTELANLSNQIGSLAKEMQTVQEKRTLAEQDLSQTSQQKRDFETRLAQARAMYDEEVKNFKVLETRLNATRTETAKLRQDYALIDGSRQDLQTQYNQVAAALAADQQENANLKEKIRQANAQVAQLKPALEKARSDARQQKGLVAINKKQLATIETERDKLQTELDDLSIAQSSAEKNQEASPAFAAVAVDSSPAASSPSQSTNPFFKRSMTASSSEGQFSPDVSNEQQRAFDSLFGPSITTAASPTPPLPPTSFRADSPSVLLPPPPFKSPASSGVPTPSVSPPPQLSQSRQFTPNFLPLGDSQSATSSTKVSPPASRFGGAETASFGTSSPGPTDKSGSVSSKLDSAQLSVPEKSGSAAQSPFDEEADSRARFPEIPLESEPTPVVPTGPEQLTQGEGQKKDLSFDELFGGPARQRSESQNANDFDEAFAGMKPNGSGADVKRSEFPPIWELDNKDDDESSESEAAIGFDDDFTVVSRPQAKEENVAPKENQPAPADTKGQLDAFPAPGAFPLDVAPSSMSQLPPVPPPPVSDAKSSSAPPEYDEGMSESKQGDLPAKFNGLLPSREDPTAAPDAPHAVESATGAPVVASQPQHKEPLSKDIGDAVSATAPPNSKNSGGASDFDAAFAGIDLAPAEEVDDDEDEGDDDDDEIVDEEESEGKHEGRSAADGEENHKRGKKKTNPDFDFSFDSPRQPVASPSEASRAAPESVSSDFFSFNNDSGNGNGIGNMTPSTGAAFPATSSSTAGGGGSGSAAHDWDALFAPLGNPKAAATSGNATSGNAELGSGTNGVHNSATHKEPGWALGADSGEDDLILKKLTAMGFPREESLSALEKFDYNIDEAADFLTSKS